MQLGPGFHWVGCIIDIRWSPGSRREPWLTLVDDNEDAGGGGGYRADGGVWVRPAGAEKPVA